MLKNRQAWIVCCALTGILIGAFGAQAAAVPAWIKFYDNLHWSSGMLGAALLVYLSARQSGSRQRRSAKRWYLLGFGGYALGQVIWDFQTLACYNAFPSPSDFFYLWFGPCLVLGLISEIKAQKRSAAHPIILLDTLSLSTASLILVLVLYLPQRGSVDLLCLSVLIAYPVSLLVAASLGLMMIPSLRLRPSSHFLGFLAAMFVTAFSWMRWNLMALTGTTIDGDPFNVTFSVAVMIAGYSTSNWHLEESHHPAWDRLCEGFLRFLPLINVLLASTAVILVTAGNKEPNIAQELTIVGALVVILLAMLRQGVLLKERQQLLLTQAFLRTVIDTVPLRIFWKDTQSRYLGCNAAFARDAGEDNPENLIGKSDYQLNWRAQAALYQEDDRAVMASRQDKLNYEEPQTTPDGQTIWLRTSKVVLVSPAEKVLGVLGMYDDITVLKDYQDRLKLTARVFEHTQEGIMIANAERKLIDVNHAFTQLTGYSRDEALGEDPRMLKSGHHSEEFFHAMWESIAETGHWSGEIWDRKKNGDIYPAWLTISAIGDDGGQVSHYVGIFSDITRLKQHEKQLERIAHYDALTGIPNRVLLIDRMKQSIAKARRDQSLLAVCYLDLDGFKPINDSHGHHVGDQVLIELTDRMTRNMRESDTLARLGGDEFVILFSGAEAIEECIASVDRLLKNIAQPIEFNNQRFTVTASIGLTIFPIDDHDPDTLLRHADQAMYKAKQSGKNQCCRYDTFADQYARIQQQFLDEIAHGIRNRQFELHYQPKIAMDDRRFAGVEALIRWNHPQKGLLPPAAFLPAIENTKLEIELGDWVIDRALAQMREWLDSGYRIPVSVNIAGPQLLENDFTLKLQKALERYSEVPPAFLELEILETAALEINRSASIIQSATAALGVSFALDDFGTGYSTLTYLKQFPVSTLKIDRSFVRDMLEDPGDRAIIEGVIALAKVFGRATVAEGVETDNHFHALKNMGCQIAQGYGIARPMPESAFMEWYLNNYSEAPDKVR